MSRIVTFAALLLACGVAHAETRLAVIPVGGSEAESLADLVQLRLAGRKDLVLLERGAIKEILREQELQGALAADAPGKRAALGKLLRADVLVVLVARDKPEPHIEIVVCETKRGLRLRTQPLKRTKNVEADVGTLIKVLDPALAKQREDLREIVAVPPLLNNSLTREMDHLQAAYARLIEESLLQRPGVLVVELSEANAVAQEVLLGGTGIDRRLPLYLVGEYRVEGASDRHRSRFTWKLRRGEMELDSRQAADLPFEELPVRLQQSAEDMLDKAIGRPRKAPDTAAERRQLSERVSAFEAVGNWLETLALAEAGLVLDPNNTEFHGQALRALNRMATERNVFGKELTYRAGSIPAEDTLRAIRCMRAALPHMEAYLRGTRLDVQKHRWCIEDPWRSLRLWLWVAREYKTLPGEMDLHEQHRLFAELYSDLMIVTNRVLQSKAASRTQDHALRLLFRFTEPPKNADASKQSPRLDAQWNPWSDWDLSTVCQHRLRLFDQFSFVTDPQNAAAFYEMVSADAWGEWSDPIHEAFLAEVEKLPNRSYSQLVRTTRALRLKITDWKPAAPPETSVLHDAEVVFHPIGLFVVGERKPFSGHVFSWMRTCSGVDGLLGDTAITSSPVMSLFLMKKKGQLIRLPLQCCEPPLHSGIYHNLCWDGRFLWVASPDLAPIQSSSALLSTPGQERFLAVVDPQSEEITRFTAEDGLPTMKNSPDAKEIGAAAVTALAPGKALVAGYFGRLWCAIASFTPEKGKKLDVFFEAREVLEATPRERQSAATVASPIGFLCTLAAPPSGGTDGSQRVLLARYGNLAPLLIDPGRRSVEVCSYELNPSEAVLFGVHDGSLYYSKQHSTTRALPVYRIGLPSFTPELVNPDVPFGPCVVDGGRVYVWHQGEMQMARTFAEPFRALRCAAPVAPFQFAALHGAALSHHYGIVVWRPGDLTWSPMRLYGAEVRSAGSLPASARENGARPGAPAFAPHTTIKLSARVSDDNNSGDIIYTWRVTSGDDVVFTDNGTKSAKDTTAILQHAGTYSFAVTITDAHGKPLPGRPVIIKAWTDPAPPPRDRGNPAGSGEKKSYRRRDVP